MPIQFGFYNKVDDATLSAGSWTGGAPLTNLQQRLLSLRARSSDALAASTQFRVDIGNDTTVIRLLGLARHTMETDATYRITAGTTAGGFDTYDSGTADVWPAVYTSFDLDWEEINWWSGKLTADEVAGYPISLLHDIGLNVVARYWTFYFNDTTNTAGYIEIARLWAGPVWSPDVNYAYGAQFGWEARDVVEYSLGGVIFSEDRAPARVLRVTLSGLSSIEAYGQVLDAQRRVGTAGELWVMPEITDTVRYVKRNFFARFRAVDPIAQAFYDLHETSMEMEELL